MQESQDRIDGTRRVQKEQEAKGRRNGWDHGGKEEHRSVPTGPSPHSGKHHSRRYGEQDLDRDAEHDDPKGVAHRQPEVGIVGKHETVIEESNPLWCLEKIEFGEREIEARQHRVQDESQESDDPRGHEKKHNKTRGSQPPPLALRNPRPDFVALCDGHPAP
jgi:hypothetical protein